MPDYTFATFSDLPDLDPDDRLGLVELERRGFSVATAVWTDENVDWARAGAVIIRSTWDYHERFDEFMRWLDRVGAVTQIWNPSNVIKRNAVKTYLRDLDARGVPVVPTEWVEPTARIEVGEILARRGWRKAVIKPVVGLATSGVRVVEAGDNGAQAHLDSLLKTGAAMVQPFLESVHTYGERALVYLGGAFSHAASKEAFQRLAVVGGAGEVAVVATPQERAVADKAIATLDSRWLFARVDVVPDDSGQPIVMEFELIEPTLFLSLADGAPQRFADAVVALRDL
jgi:glutathione synthase/RimK-type ligase-like ATP-grasp enzyme